MYFIVKISYIRVTFTLFDINEQPESNYEQVESFLLLLLLEFGLSVGFLTCFLVFVFDLDSACSNSFLAAWKVGQKQKHPHII